MSIFSNMPGGTSAASSGGSTGLTGGIFGAASDLFSGFAEMQGAYATADMYTQAAGYAKLDLKIKQTLVDRQNFGIIGGQKSDIASAGLAGSGTALDLMRDTAQQAALTKQLTTVEGTAQIKALEAQASAAEAAGTNDLIGGILGAVGQVLPFVI